jgi:hypothetical protein
LTIKKNDIQYSCENGSSVPMETETDGDGLVNLTRDGKDLYCMDCSNESVNEADEADEADEVVDVDGNKIDVYDFELTFAKNDEQWLVIEDTRHGKKGFRVSRYLPVVDRDDCDWMWDEWYMFFESMDDVYKAFKYGWLEYGRKNF